MSENDETGTTAVVSKRGKDDKPSPGDFFRVVATHPNLNGRTMFRSLSQKRAQTWLEKHYPRGSEAHLVTPDGETHHFENERTGERGTDIEQWQPFDPSAWVPVEQAPPPGQDAWSDTEG